MFNHHFFRGQKSEPTYKKFLHEDDGTSSSHGNTLIIMDPPFGGMVNVLSRTVGRIQKDWKEVNPGKYGSGWGLFQYVPVLR